MTQDEIILAQQARIERLKLLLEIFYVSFIDYAESRISEEFMTAVLEAVATPDDLSVLRAHDAELTAKHIEICKKLAAENEGLAGEVWCERCADAIEKGCV